MARAGISDTCIFCIALLFFCTAACAATANRTGMTMEQTIQQPSALPYGIRLFAAEEGSIHSTQVTDATNGKHGEVLFATTFGLAEYNSTWSMRHLTRGNVSRGLLNDFVTAVEYDDSGNLWIGYSGGLQVYNGRTYETIRDQQILKDPRVVSLQRWGNTMWIATGNAGIHRYRNGTWTWYQPMSPEGTGFYQVDSMARDPQADALVITTLNEGIWEIASPEDPVSFRQVEDPGNPPAVWHVRQDPLGGVYVFDDRTIRKYSSRDGSWTHILAAADLTQQQIDINNIVAAPDGALFIGTDDGIYVWQDGAVVRRLGRYEGIGPSNVVRWLFADARKRIWFATQDVVGYYTVRESGSATVPVYIVNQSVPAEAAIVQMTAPITQVITQHTVTPAVASDTGPEKKPSLLEQLYAFFSSLFS